MMKLKLFLGLLLFSSSASALDIVPLYRNDTLRTYLSLPFKVESNTAENYIVRMVSFDENISGCRSLIDPYINTNFFIKCEQEVSTRLHIILENSEGRQKVTYGPITISKIAAAGDVVTPTVPGKSPEYILGESLYYEDFGGVVISGKRIKSCAECHGAPINKKGVGEASLASSLSTQPKMKVESIQAKQPLTAEQIKALVTFINGQ